MNVLLEQSLLQKDILPLMFVIFVLLYMCAFIRGTGAVGAPEDPTCLAVQAIASVEHAESF